MERVVKITLFFQVISMWSSKEAECGLRSWVGPKNLVGPHHLSNNDGNLTTSQVGGPLENLRLDKALWMHSSKIIQKRDSWELVAAGSDVINVNHGKISSDRPVDVYNRYKKPQSASLDFIPSRQIVQMRLNKLEHYFQGLRIHDEDCRRRFLCEMSKDPAKFYPLSSAFLDETSFNSGSPATTDGKLLSARLLTSDEGSRLLNYIEASQWGLHREGCDIWTYRCPHSTESLIDYKSLVTWREVLKWLTVQMVARRH